MKKLLIFGILFLLIGLRPIGVDSQSADNNSSPSPNPVSTWQPPASVIDNISVPYDVLSYVQMEYQGYAVTQVRKITRGGMQAYQLTADRDDQPYNDQVIYLYFDMNWQLIGDEKAMPRQQATSEPEPQPTEPPTEQIEIEEVELPEDESEVEEEEEEADEEENDEEDPDLRPERPTTR
jgi:hypothetical protein